MATISDVRKPVAFTNNPNKTAYYLPVMMTSCDYYPFGMLIPERTYSSNITDYPTSYQYYENVLDLDFENNYGDWTIIGNSSYSFSNGSMNITHNSGFTSGVFLEIDTEIDSTYTVTLDFDIPNYSVVFSAKDSQDNDIGGLIISGSSNSPISFEFQATSDISKILIVIFSSTPKTFTIHDLSVTGKHPKTANVGLAYRYGFNSQEKDDEIYGTGNSYTAEYWQYDARLGRRWNLDPVDQISVSNYACFRNNPIYYIDIPGDSVWVYATRLPNGKSLINKATHTFIVVKTADGKFHYYAYGPEDGYPLGRDKLERSYYSEDRKSYENKMKDKSHVKAKLLIEPPPNMTQEEFDQAVIDAAESFGNYSGFKYNITSSSTSGNCNSSTTTILFKAGVSEKQIEIIGQKIPVIKWGWGAVIPWTYDEQKEAVTIKDQYHRNREQSIRSSGSSILIFSD